MGVGAVASADAARAIAGQQADASRGVLDPAQARVEAHGVACTRVARSGDEPWSQIIAAAQDHGCDLVFMASHGRRGVQALLLGSQAKKVLTHSSIPVLVYRPPVAFAEGTTH